MTKYLARLLGADEATFARRVALLEDASLNTGVDIRISTSISLEMSQKIAALQLDPKDTTAEELYHAVRTAALSSEHWLRVKLKCSNDTPSTKLLQAVAKQFKLVAQKQMVWSVKKSSIKKILGDVPPKKTMKALNYRSGVSMLKRESAIEVYVLACLIESENYRHKLTAAMKKLKPSDFEERQLEILALSEKRWQTVRKHLRQRTVPVYSVPEVSAIVVLPISIEQTDCLALLASALLLKEVRHCIEHVSYVKLKTLDPNLHQHIETITTYGKIPLFTLHGEQVYWHHVHHVLGRMSELPQQVGPHMGKQDVAWLNIEAQLSSMVPELSFWIGTHRLAFVTENNIVSMHLIDVCMNVLYNLSIENSSAVFVREVVADEFIESYMSIPPFTRFVDDHIYKLTDIENEILYASKHKKNVAIKI